MTANQTAPGWVSWLRRLTDYMAHDFGGGPRPWKFSWVINFQKCGTFFFLGFLMWYYSNDSMAAWIYLAMMVWHWLPFLVLAWVWIGLFAVNMIMKEASMSRYSEWAEYKSRSWWILPRVF